MTQDGEQFKISVRVKSENEIHDKLWGMRIETVDYQDISKSDTVIPGHVGGPCDIPLQVKVSSQHYTASQPRIPRVELSPP
jgi:hypothetical protein